MFKLDDLNPLFKPPSALVKPSYGLEGSQAGNSNPPFDERQLTETNYYKLATTSKINCYFYQVQDFPTAQRSSLAPTTSPTDSKQGSSNGTSDANASPLQQIHTYDSIIKAKLASDYSIRDTITYVAKREICIFQMEIREHDANSDIGFNQLKDAIDNIINENKIHLKLVSATRFDSNAVLKQLPPQPANRPINIIYLSFLRAVKKYITLRLTKVHRLPDTSVDILPFGNQMIVSSTVEKPTEGSTCKQLNDGSYSILKMSPSLGFRNDLMLNISMSNSLKLYKLSEFLNTESFMDRKDYVIYICPSGVRCLCAINNSLADSITDEAPINYDRLVKLLEQHTTINLPFNDPNRKPPICRKWIKLIPNINHMNGLTPKISKYLESFILNTKYIMWPVELCFVQFSADSAKFQTTPLPKSRGDNGLEIENPLALIEDFIDLSNSDSIARELLQTDSVMEDVAQTSPAADVENEDDDWDELFGGEAEEGADVLEEDHEDNDEGSAANQLKSNSTDAPSNSKDLTPFPGAVLYNPVTNPLYEDPGAPSPISFQIFAPSTPPNETPATSIDENKAFTPKDANKSIFAPLNFNPLIEKDIDSKYSNGGKFFVKNGTESPILALPTKDSMSASATTPTFWRTGNLPSKRKFGESTFEDKATNSDLISDTESLSNELDVRPDDSNHGLGLGIASGGPVNSSFMNGGLSTTLGNTGILSSAASSMTPNISSAVFSSNTVAVPSPVTTSLTQDANEIQNWLYWILRGPSTSTIPTYFLSVSNPHISPDKLASILPILQELILFSPLDICTKDLSIMSRNRENPSMLNPEVESVMDSVFPGISKMKLHEILECSKQIEAAVPFECLFRSDKNNSKIDKQHNQSQLIKQEPAARLEFDDPSFATTSPLMNMNSNPELETRRNASVSRDSNAVTNKMIAESTSSNSLFRVPSTIINSKRLDHDLKINQASLNFWKILNLQPVMGMKDFEVLFIVPKTFEFFRQKSIDFMDSVIDSYKDCKLGTIKKLKVDAVDLDGLLEIEATSEAEFWANIDIQLNEVAKNFQDEFISSKKTYTNPILLLFATPFTDLISIVKMSSAINTFNMTLTEKIIEQEPPSDEDKRKKRKKSTVQSKIMLPINVFHKALPMELYFSQAGSFSVCSDQQLVDLALKLYNLCPTTQASREMKKGDRFKDRDPFFTVAKDLPSKIFFMLTKTPIAKNLISDELFLHVCYERSIDKNWCVASWTDQYGSINYIKSWYTNAEIKGSKSFEQVSNEIMEITLDYTSTHNGKSYVILTRLSNMIPDDELTEWKRLSVQNNKLTLIVLTVELEPSTLILSHHQNATQSSKKDDIKEFYSVRYTVGSTNSQMPTPNFASSVNNKMESPEINNSMQTPSYDLITSPIDSASMMTGHHYAGSHNLQSNGVNAENQVLIELSDECYGVILQMAQPLSNQSIRLPLKTGFLINA
ncbi:hypothetical protein CANARDRAFT_185586, partial [[Candida] arabinofermentans NRRL YB-2248]